MQERVLCDYDFVGCCPGRIFRLDAYSWVLDCIGQVKRIARWRCALRTTKWHNFYLYDILGNTENTVFLKAMGTSVILLLEISSTPTWSIESPSTNWLRKCQLVSLHSTLVNRSTQHLAISHAHSRYISAPQHIDGRPSVLCVCVCICQVATIH